MKMESYAQNGEDRFILEFLRSISNNSKLTKKMIACEFGAHDGWSNSNLRLINEAGWPLVFIEADKKRFLHLKKNNSSSDITLIMEYIGITENTLGEILLRNGIEPQDVGIISIDIDGDDLGILESIYWDIDICVIEYNPTIPFDTKFRNPIGKSFGNSALSIIEVAESKNLIPVQITETNIILINKKYSEHCKQIQLDEIGLEHQLRLALAYDGSVILTNRSGENFTREVLPLGWTNFHWVQPIPKFLRVFNRFERTKSLLGIIQILVRPDAWLEIGRYVIRNYRRSGK